MDDFVDADESSEDSQDGRDVGEQAAGPTWYPSENTSNSIFHRINNLLYVFLLDVSGSMKGSRIEMAKKFISEFEDKPHEIYLFSRAFRVMHKPIRFVDSEVGGGTAMVKAMDKCADELVEWAESKYIEIKFTMITDATYNGERSKWEFLIAKYAKVPSTLPPPHLSQTNTPHPSATETLCEEFSSRALTHKKTQPPPPPPNRQENASQR